MNRRRFFRAAASFVAGCAIGLGLRPKLDAIENVVVSPDYEMIAFFERNKLELIEDENGILYIGKDGVRAIKYAERKGQWHKLNEPTRKT